MLLGHNVHRTPLDLFEDARDVLAHHAKRHHLQAGEQQDADNQRAPARYPVAPDEIGQHHPRAIQECDQGRQHADQRDHTQRPGGEGRHAVDGEVQQPQGIEAGQPALARERLIGDGHGTEARPGIQPLHETVALGQAPQGQHHLAVHQAEIPRIGRNAETRSAVDGAVEQTGADLLEGFLVVAVAADGIYHFRSVMPVLQHHGDQRRRMLKVGVHENHRIAMGHVDAGGNGSFLTEIARKVHGPHAADLPAQLSQGVARVVAAAIVDDNDFPGHACAIQLLAQHREQTGQIVRLVIGRNDAGQGQRGRVRVLGGGSRLGHGVRLQGKAES